MSAPALLAPGVVDYVRGLAAETPLQARVRAECARRRLPNVPPETGAALRAFAAATRARDALEVGGLLGYSGLFLLDGLGPLGRLTTVELDPNHAREARATFAEAGAGERARVLLGDARTVLGGLPHASFDLVFLDADKRQYVDYLAAALPLLRPGGVVLADNLLWSGRVADPHATDDDTEGLRRYTEAILGNPRLVSTVLPVGDGLGVSVLRPPSG